MIIAALTLATEYTMAARVPYCSTKKLLDHQINPYLGLGGQVSFSPHIISQYHTRQIGLHHCSFLSSGVAEHHYWNKSQLCVIRLNPFPGSFLMFPILGALWAQHIEFCF